MRRTSLHALVAGQALAGILAALVVVRVHGGEGTGPARTVLVYAVALAAMYAVPLQVPRGEDLEDIDLSEPLLVAMLFVLPPAGVLAGIAFALVVANVVRQRSPLKAVFNLGMGAVAAGLAVLVHGSLSASGQSPTADALAVLMAAAAFVLYETAAVYLAISVAERRSFRAVARESLALGAVVSGIGIALGLGLGLAAGVAWWAPLTILPARVAVMFLLRDHVKAMRDRTRLAGLLRAAADAHSSVDVRAVAGAVCASARHLLGAHTAEMRDAPPTGDELGAVVRSGEDARWLVVRDRHRLDPFEPGEQTLLDGLATIGSAALDNAYLIEHVQHQALHDSLTGLPNRLLFQDRLEQAVVRGERLSQRFAVLYLDVDRFKRVNDSLGHGMGDELLRQVALRIREAVRLSDTVARIGGDEFTVLLHGVRDEREPVAVAEQILRRLRAPFAIGDRQLFVTASIGIAMYPDHGTGYETLLANADLALYAAKQRSRDTFEVYAGGTGVGHARLVLESHLHHAIARGEIWVAYQPLVDLRRGAIAGVEALVRWNHPTFGLLAPDQFIPVAEESGLIVELDAFVLDTACRQIAAWNVARPQQAPLRVAVNLSARQLQSPQLARTITDALAGSGLPAWLLEVEVTERLAGRETFEVRAVLQQLRALGVQVAMDDFGTGYSALSRLDMLPLDTVKIDKSFVRRILNAEDRAPIVAATIAMAHGLGLRVTAEGVETTAQLHFLQAHDCDAVQGFLFGRPVDAASSAAGGPELIDLIELARPSA